MQYGIHHHPQYRAKVKVHIIVNNRPLCGSRSYTRKRIFKLDEKGNEVPDGWQTVVLPLIIQEDFAGPATCCRCLKRHWKNHFVDAPST